MICRCPHCGSRFKPENRHGTIGYLVYRCPECSQDSFVSPHRIAAVSGICLLAALGGWLVVLAMIIGCSRAGLAVPRFLLLFVAPFTMLVAVVIAAKSRHGLLDPLTRDKTVPGVLSLS
ncbi:hypothetical protein GX586_07640, partial [bacterium]|nr:hypothetical protein [bacterium]